MQQQQQQQFDYNIQTIIINKINMQIVIIGLLIWIYQSRLLKTVVLFRHGARSAFRNQFTQYLQQLDHHISTDLTNNTSQQEKGQLIGSGFRQLYNLGQQFRNRFDKQSFQIYSTDTDRTIQSARSFIIGLLGLQFNITDLHFQQQIANVNDIAIDVHKSQFDHLFQQTLNCPNYNILINQQIQTQQYKIFNQSYQHIYQQLNDQLNKYDSNGLHRFNSIKDLYNLKHLKDTYDYSNQQFGLFAELWDRLQHDIYKAYLYWVYKVQLANSELNLLQNYNLLKYLPKILENEQNQLQVFSVHDNNIAALLSVFNQIDDSCFEKNNEDKLGSVDNCQVSPEFSSSIIIEKHEIEDEVVIKVYFNNRIINICRQQFCFYSQFYDDYIKKYVEMEQKHYSQICSYKTDDKQKPTMLYLIIGFEIVVLVYLIISMLNKKRELDEMKKSLLNGVGQIETSQCASYLHDKCQNTN